MSIAGGCDARSAPHGRSAFKRVQLFTKNNNQWKAPALTETHIAAFRAALAETGIVDPVAHNSYLINLGSPDDVLWNNSIDAMIVELERARRSVSLDLVAHPGCTYRLGRRGGNRANRGGTRRGSSTDCLESRRVSTWKRQPGRGAASVTGSNISRKSFKRVREPERLGVCVDTCHIFAAGYSFETPEEYDGTMDELDRTVGFGRVRVWHLNDSVRERGSRVDRHAGIGRGQPGPRAVPPHPQRPPFPRDPHDSGNTQGDRGGRGARRIESPRVAGAGTKEKT